METFVNESCEALALGNTILYPTDTIWGIGCDATNDAAIKNIYKIIQLLIIKIQMSFVFFRILGNERK